MRAKLIAVAIGCCLLLVLLQCSPALAEADEHAEVCRLFKSGTKLRKPGTCDKYIVCAGDDGTVHSCDAGKIYDVSKESCVADDGSCNTAAVCSGVTDHTWVADPTTCHSFFYCVGGEASVGYCPLKYHFDESAQMCVHDVTSGCIGFNGLCSVVKDNTEFRDETDCGSYYVCSKGKLTSKKCSSKYYDVQTNKCVAKNEVECEAHTNPGCGTDKSPKVGMISDEATCRGYFVCQDFGVVADLEPKWYQCPGETFFDATKKACVEPTQAVCKHNRCEGRGDILVSASSNDCHDYIVCESGKEVSAALTCHNGLFFSEELQSCVKTVIEYPSCVGQK